MKLKSLKIVYLLSKALCSPLESLFSLMIFILAKEFEVTALQLTLLACIRSVSSLFAFNISALCVGRIAKGTKYLAFTTLIGAFPVLFFPFVTNVWYFIFCYFLFLTMNRATFPVWTEILKSQLGTHKIGNVFATAASVNSLLMISVPFCLSYWMDTYADLWKVLFSLLAVVQILSLTVLLYLEFTPTTSSPSFDIFSVWKGTWKHLKENPEYAKFQLFFFLSGAGLVAIYPILPTFFNEKLQLSYVQLTSAFSLCKGIGIVISSPIWAYISKKISIYRLNYIVNMFSCLFIVSLLASEGEVSWLYLAYLMFGAMQGGCDLSWHIAGPTFAKENESTLYSSETLALIGIRGCIFPFIGQFIFSHSNIVTVFTLSGLLCFFSIFYGVKLERQQKQIALNKIYQTS